MHICKAIGLKYVLFKRIKHCLPFTKMMTINTLIPQVHKYFHFCHYIVCRELIILIFFTFILVYCISENMLLDSTLKKW